MWRNFKIGVRLTIWLFLIAVGSVATIGYLAYDRSKTALEEGSFDLLTAVREMKAKQIEAYFENINDQITTFSASPSTMSAVAQFKTGFNALHDSTRQTNPAKDSTLFEYYDQEFIPRLSFNKSNTAATETYFPKDPGIRLIQDLYISSNPFPIGEKHKLIKADDGSHYSEIHAQFHPYFKAYLEKFGYYDIFLIDDKTGAIVYTVFKEVDFGTSLIEGPYSNTNFARAYRQVIETDSISSVHLVDYEPYHPSYDAMAAFIAAPIYKDGKRIGVVAFQMPIDKINSVMTSDENWEAVGLGKSGETYIVGEDYTLRNQSRFLIEDSNNYFDMIEKIGLSDSIIQRIKNFNSTIGLQPVKTEGTMDALQGKSNTRIFEDYRGVRVLSSYKPLDIDGVHWVLMSEIDEAEAFAPVNQLRNGLLWVFVAIMPFIFGIAYVISRRITKPLKGLSKGALQLAKGNLRSQIEVGGKDEIGILALSFKKMQTSIQNLVGELRDINTNLENKVRNRTIEIERHRDMLSEKNREILDSINYAKRLQNAIMPTTEKIQEHLSQSFILFEPKDIVSGDFYWMDIRGDEMLIAAVDCTGHGVPGAMVSVVGSNNLNRCVKEFGLKYPAEILDKLTDLVIETFKTKADDVRDGMDIALCSINLKSKKLTYAGAHNPLWILRKNHDEITEIKANKQPVGMYEFRKPFVNHEVKLEEGDIVYLFSDGYADQFGGPRGKKLKHKTMKSMIVESRNENMQRQCETLRQKFFEWKGDVDQIDDVCIIGIRV